MSYHIVKSTKKLEKYSFSICKLLSDSVKKSRTIEEQEVLILVFGFFSILLIKAYEHINDIML